MRFDLSRYSKSIADLLIGFHAWLAWVVITKPGPITSVEWVALAAVFVKAALVWLVPNTPAPAKAKPPMEAGGARVPLLCVVVLVIGAVTTPSAIAPLRANAAHAGATRTVIFRDDFNGTSLDLTKWQPNWLGASNTTITPPINGNEESCYDPQQVSVSGGYLHLRAVARSCTDKNGHTWAYASGMVESHDHFSFTTGTLRARVWLPGTTLPENWPAVWTDGLGQWPKTGEIDALEVLHGKACWHVHDTAGGPGSCDTTASTPGWHTVKYVRTSSSVSFYYDKRLVGTLSTSNFATAAHYVILSQQLSSSISPPIVVPSEMKIDWIEVDA